VDCDAEPKTFTAYTITAPTSDNFDNVDDVTASVSFGGSWALTNAAGTAVSGITLAGVTDITWTATETANLTAGNVYTLTWTPAYSGDGTPSNSIDSSATLSVEISYCNFTTTKKSDAAITVTPTGGNLTTTCSSITSIAITAPTSSDFSNVDPA
jgi:hypothetical protein